MTIRIAVGQAATPSDELLSFAKQLGASGVQLNTPDLPGESRWEYDDLMALRERCETAGLRLEAIENVPNRFYQGSMLGTATRDEEIDNVCYTIGNLGRAGITILGLNFLPGSVWRTEITRGRGGASVTGFDFDVATDPARQSEVLVARRDQRVEGVKDSFVRGAQLILDRQLDDAAMWQNFEYFIKPVAAAAARSGVRLALHPDDPPVTSLGGIAHILRSVDALKRALALADSGAVGVNLCLGTISSMGGEASVLEAINHFGPRGQIVYVHFRDVKGTVPRFTECFLGEGNYNPLIAMRALVRSGFDGFILDDHSPKLIADSDYAHRGRAHAIGILEGLLRASLDELT